MKVLYVTAECWPFIKTGGLGDVAYALPKALKKEGVDVRVIMPKYSNIPTYLKDKFKPVAEFSVKVGWRNQYCGIESMELDGVTFYFIDNEFYFKRSDQPSIYGHGDDPGRRSAGRLPLSGSGLPPAAGAGKAAPGGGPPAVGPHSGLLLRLLQNGYAARSGHLHPAVGHPAQRLRPELHRGPAVQQRGKARRLLP